MRSKKDLFCIRHIPIEQQADVIQEGHFPPQQILFSGERLSYLGKSNKSDLLNVAQLSRSGEDVACLEDALAQNRICQYIYTDAKGELMEVALHQTLYGTVLLCAIRTRRKAEK